MGTVREVVEALARSAGADVKATLRKWDDWGKVANRHCSCVRELDEHEKATLGLPCGDAFEIIVNGKVYYQAFMRVRRLDCEQVLPRRYTRENRLLP